MNTENKIPEELLDKIISVAYNDADLVDKLVVWKASIKNPEIKKILNEYRNTANNVHSLDETEYKTQIPVFGNQKSEKLADLVYILFKKPAFSAAFVLMLIAGITGYFVINENNSVNGYSKSELVYAEKQAKESFAIVASYFSSARTKIQRDVFQQNIQKPIKKNLNIIDKYITGG